MRHPQEASLSLFQAMRNRWRTGGASASMTLSQAHPSAEASHAGKRARPRKLSESQGDKYGIVQEKESKGWGGASTSPGKSCPKCGSNKITGWMPTDFESAKCANCGKVYEPGNGPMPESVTEGRFLTIQQARDAFEDFYAKEGNGLTREQFIRKQIIDQELDFVRMTGRVDQHSQRVISQGLGEAVVSAADSDYDPTSTEPRFLQLAKAELAKRRDLTCRDCGFVGLPASVDMKCPECGGLMDSPEARMTTAASQTDQIRAAIRQQVLDFQQRKLNFPESVQEWTKSPTHSHEHDIHVDELVTYYGFKSNGNHYVLDTDKFGDSDSPTGKHRLWVNSKGAWVHKHHGVHHEGHGAKSLAAHLARTIGS